MNLNSRLGSVNWNGSSQLSQIFCPCKIDRDGSASGSGIGTRTRTRTRRNFGSVSLTGKFCSLKGLSSGRILRRCCMDSASNGHLDNMISGFENSVRCSGELLVDELHHENMQVQMSSNDIDHEKMDSQEKVEMPSNFTTLEEDPLLDKLRTQLGVIHPMPAPRMNTKIGGMFAFFFVIGIVFDKLWGVIRRYKSRSDARLGIRPQVPPTSVSLLFEKDLQRKESVEWVNMVLEKLWKVYRTGIENWIISSLQPVLDDLEKPSYVRRVEIKQFSLGEEPLVVRTVERKTSRRVNDLQYQIGLRYAGSARFLLMLSLDLGIGCITLPVGVREFDIDGEVWVKLRLMPKEPWVGVVSWAFVSLPKIKFELSLFQLINLMTIPVLSLFLRKLLTEDLPRLFVHPNKVVLDFQEGKAVGPISNDSRTGEIEEGDKDFVGELSVTLVDARQLAYVFYGKTDPYVVLSLGGQVLRSKRNTKTTVTGPPGEPVWNQDFHMLVANPKTQKLIIQVKDSLGFADFTIGTGEVELKSLQDTVPTDTIVVLQRGWGIFRKGLSGQILLRLTYKAYYEDAEDDGTKVVSTNDVSDDELSIDEAKALRKQSQRVPNGTYGESFMDELAALFRSEEFLGIMASDTGSTKVSEDASNMNSTVSGPNSRISGSSPLNSENSKGGSDNPRGSPLFWLGIITTIAILVAINIGGSSLFNP